MINNFNEHNRGSPLWPLTIADGNRYSMKLCSPTCGPHYRHWLWLIVGWLSISYCNPVLANNQQQLDQLKSEIQQLKGWLDKAKGDYSNADNALRQSDEEISDVLKNIEKIRRQLQQEKQQLQQLQQQQKSLQSQQLRQQQGLQQQVRQTYQLGQSQAMKLWLSTDDPGSVQRSLRYHGYFSRARAQTIEQITTDLHRLRTIQLDISQQQARLEQTEATLNQRYSRLAEQRQQQKDVVAKLQREMTSNEKNLRQKTEDQARLKALLEEVSALATDYSSMRDKQPFNSMRGQLPRPLKGRIINSFGQRNISARNRWQGWQIAATDGQPVKAVHHGQVVFADWLRGFGLLLILDHGDDYLTLYAHNQTLFFEPGNWVGRGDIIAESGRSGGLTDARLYFEIRHQGQPKDPANWLIGRG